MHFTYRVELLFYCDRMQEGEHREDKDTVRIALELQKKIEIKKMSGNICGFEGLKIISREEGDREKV